MKKTVLAMMAIAMLATTSCKKEDKAAVTKENISGSYKTVAIKSSVNGAAETDGLDACEKDDINTFKTDMTFSFDGGADACSMINSSTGTWSIANSTTLVIADEQAIIKSFDGTQLVLVTTDVDPDTSETTVSTATMVKQ